MPKTQYTEKQILEAAELSAKIEEQGEAVWAALMTDEGNAADILKRLPPDALSMCHKAFALGFGAGWGAGAEVLAPGELPWEYPDGK